MEKPRLSCIDGDGIAWIEVRSLFNLLGPSGYNELLRALTEAGFQIERSRSYTWAIINKPCQEATAIVEGLLSRLMEKEEGGGEGGEEESKVRCVEPDVGRALSRVREVVVGYVPSLGGVVDFLVENLEAGNHVILLGGPGTGKTLILDAIYEAASSPLYINMADATSAGIEDLVIEAGCVDFLLLDEVDKARNVALSPLLQLLDHGGRLRVTKSGKTTTLEMPWVRAVAAANPYNPRLRARNWWEPLMDRLVPIEVPQPSIDEIVNFMGRVANAQMPTWVRELVERHLDVITLRKASQVAKYITTAMRKGKNEEEVKKNAEKILTMARAIGLVSPHQRGIRV